MSRIRRSAVWTGSMGLWMTMNSNESAGDCPGKAAKTPALRRPGAGDPHSPYRAQDFKPYRRIEARLAKSFENSREVVA